MNYNAIRDAVRSTETELVTIFTWKTRYESLRRVTWSVAAWGALGWLLLLLAKAGVL